MNEYHEIRSHRAPSRQIPPALRAAGKRALALFGALALVLTLAGTAEAKPVKPKANEGWIALTKRACGNDGTKWTDVRAANGGAAWLYLGHTYNVVCKRDAKTSRSAPRTTTTKPAAWVKPGPGGCGEGFGPRTWRDEFHYGQDIRTGYGARIVSAAAGTVTATGWSGKAGLRVWVRVSKTTELGVMHLSSIAVHTGQRVRAGQLLGRSGSTGDSTGPHLHFAVRINGVYVNPKPFMAKHGVKVC